MLTHSQCSHSLTELCSNSLTQPQKAQISKSQPKKRKERKQKRGKRTPNTSRLYAASCTHKAKTNVSAVRALSRRCAQGVGVCIQPTNLRPLCASIGFSSCFSFGRFFVACCLRTASRQPYHLCECRGGRGVAPYRASMSCHSMHSRPTKRAVILITTACCWLTVLASSRSDLAPETYLSSVFAKNSCASDDTLEARVSRRNELRQSAMDYRRRCWINASTQSNRFRIGPSHYVLDAQFGVVYLEVPKSASTAIASNLRQASSTTQPLRKGSWHIEQSSQNSNGQSREMLWFSCVRDPVARFVSNVNFLTVMDRSLQHLRNPSRGNVSGLRAANAIVDRILRQGFFNWHLWPQSLYLSRFVALVSSSHDVTADYPSSQCIICTNVYLHRPNGEPAPLHFLCDAESPASVESMFEAISHVRGFPEVQNDRVPPAHGTYTREPILRISDLSNETTEKICQVYLPDYCCFGFSIPDACDAVQMNTQCATVQPVPRVGESEAQKGHAPDAQSLALENVRTQSFDAEVVFTAGKKVETKNGNRKRIWDHESWSPEKAPHLYTQAAAFVARFFNQT